LYDRCVVILDVIYLFIEKQVVLVKSSVEDWKVFWKFGLCNWNYIDEL